MRKFLLRVLFFIIPFMWWIYATAQPPKGKDCSTTCFSTELVGTEKLSPTCTAYEMKVSYSGACAHALSHFSVAIPCGDVQDIWNSEGWKQEIGTDPTTGINGFKIDDISDFGEGSISTFTVTFTVCSTTEDCASQMPCWQPEVAYKAATCVNYETVAVNCSRLDASLVESDASCFGASDGMLSVKIEEGKEPYTFLWSDGRTEQSRSDLSAGDYSVIVSDASGAEVTLEGRVGQPQQISIVGQVMPASCNGAADGSVNITVTGGTGTYAFEWSNGAASEDLTLLSSGKYTVTVRDENNCASTADFYIENNSSINLTALTMKPDCNEANGSIDITVIGGSEPYIFEWSTGATTQDITSVGAGLYSVRVTDNAGCSVDRTFILHENNTLKLSGMSTATSCAEDASGAIDLNVTGGTSPYQFQWSNGETTEDLAALTSGLYRVVVTDAKGCEATAAFNVSKRTFTVPKQVIQPSCHGETNGSISLGEPVGGTPPYSYEWSTGQTGNSLTDLAPGNYLVTITDATGCSRTISTTISSPAELNVSATVSNSDCGSDGAYSIDLTVTGGTPPYSFEWSDGITSEDRSGISTGSYTVIITDANGCSTTKEIVVQDQDPTWSCTIQEPAVPPVCGSTNNTLSTSILDADAYSWHVESSDDSWVITSDINSASITFVAGSENTTATFTLQITKDGCTRTCTYVTGICTPDDDQEEPGGEDPGGEDPGGEDPGGENPGGEDPGGEEPGGEEPGGEQPGDGGSGGNQPCDECLSTEATLIAESGGCRTYEMVIDTNGLCRYDLSHWTLAIPCGTISNYSNSEGWKMEYGKDPTTGLYGLKVDDISGFGKRQGSFTVTFTLCESGSCDLAYWDPTVAYKAGQCVAVENIEVTPTGAEVSTMAVYPNPFTSEIHFQWSAQNEYASLEIIDQYGNVVSRSNKRGTQGPEGYSMVLDAASLPRGMYYYRMTVDGKVHNGKISKR